MPLIPLRGLSVFPNMVLHFDVGRDKSILAIERAMMQNQMVFLVSQKDADVNLPGIDDFYHIGTVVRIKQMIKLSKDNIRVLVDGRYRARLVSLDPEKSYFLANIEKIESPLLKDESIEVHALMKKAVDMYRSYLKLNPNLSVEAANGIENIDEVGKLADVIGAGMMLKVSDAQSVIEAIDPLDRLNIVINLLVREIDLLALEDKINSKVKSKIDKSQREFYLREQMRVIQDELGGGETTEAEIDQWRQKLDALRLSDATALKIKKEIDRLSRMGSNTADANVSRTYIETILDLPWRKSSQINNDLIKAKEVLDAEHFGLEKVKDRIVEYLAVSQLAGTGKGSILCLVGPPGVGKTSVAKSIANATGRKFVRMSLGGIKDEAEIRGHRRTYIGAIPGRVMNAVSECGANNPVFLFDEVDKIGADFRGDPADALLEVLDPEQNKEFVDHYLEVPFDLSNVFFITTANSAETIPAPLLDRMEVINLSGYTPQEKFEIAKRYLVPKQIRENGLTAKNISFTDSAIRLLVDNYTREAGVRNLEKKIGKLCRKVARQVVEGCDKKISITAAKLKEYLPGEDMPHDKRLSVNEVGVATGLAWTRVGGETLFIETAVLPGSGKLELTGSLGDVMQESAKAAVSYIRANAKEFGVVEDFYKTKDIHIHIPEGAVPKDGPSAGVTMCTSVVSALSGRAVRKDIAMTGEISLRGAVLPVGGIKEKMIAAHRLGVKTVLLPEDNKRDLDELPQVVKDEVRFITLKRIEDALKEALI